jgi:hypothetical protein
MGRRHRSLLAIEQEACQQAWVLCFEAPGAARSILLKLGLDGIKQALRDDSFMLTVINLSFVDDLAKVDLVRKQVIKRASSKTTSTPVRAAGPVLNLGRIALGVQMIAKVLNGWVLEILFEDVSDERRFFGVRGQPPVLKIISQRNRASHPHAFALRRRNLVTDALAGGVEISMMPKK